MKELVEHILKALVDQPDKVQVTENQREGSLTIEVRVADEDTGRVIGREGRIVNALRTVVKAAGAKDQQRISVEIISKDKEEIQ